MVPRTHSKKQPINLSEDVTPTNEPQRTPFFCFRPGKMVRIWRSFCWKRATVFMASFDDPLVSIPHVSIISSTRREWWVMMGDWLKWSMWLMWLRCGWCDWCGMWLKITLFSKLYAMWMWESFVSWSSNPPHPKRFRVGTDEVLLQLGRDTTRPHPSKCPNHSRCINMNFTRLNPCVKYSDLQKFSLFLGHPFSFLSMVQITGAITIESHGFWKTMEIIWMHRYKLKHQLPTSQPVVSSANLKRQIREQCFYQPPVALGTRWWGELALWRFGRLFQFGVNYGQGETFGGHLLERVLRGSSHSVSG